MLPNKLTVQKVVTILPNKVVTILARKVTVELAAAAAAHAVCKLCNLLSVRSEVWVEVC